MFSKPDGVAPRRRLSQARSDLCLSAATARLPQVGGWESDSGPFKGGRTCGMNSLNVVSLCFRLSLSPSSLFISRSHFQFTSSEMDLESAISTCERKAK